MPRSREACSKTRSRPTQVCAYSPTGPIGSFSVEAGAPGGTSGYTFPLEKTTIRLSAKCGATMDGTTTFWAQVRSGRPEEPNLRPARKRTFGTRGSRATCEGSRRSHAIGLDAVALRAIARGRARRSARRRGRGASRRPRRRPGRRAARARGPSCPPAPSTTTSPVRVRAKSTSAGEGRESSSSSSPSSRTASGHGGCSALIEVSRPVEKTTAAWPPLPREGAGTTPPWGGSRRSLSSRCGTTLAGANPSRCAIAAAQHDGRRPVVDRCR